MFASGVFPLASAKVRHIFKLTKFFDDIFQKPSKKGVIAVQSHPYYILFETNFLCNILWNGILVNKEIHTLCYDKVL